MAWRAAKSLDVLRKQIDEIAPSRDKSSDGTIGDAAHQARKSDHNPDAGGVVRAMDITHDPGDGVDTYAIAEQLRKSRDPRIQYVISNGRIFNKDVKPWQWRTYNGSNPHTHHVHISVVGNSKADDTSPWQVTKARPLLKFGSEGEAVKELQAALDIPADGIFGPQTFAAVSAFQTRNGLEVDGIVGPYTWAALSGPQATRFHDITATVFGGSADPQRSAYDEHLITDDELGVALPYRFKGDRPRVRVFHGDQSIVADIVDVGPWNINDPYWQTNARPQAETGTDTRGRKTNLAGIDLTPAAARELGLDGKGKVDWEFVGGDVVSLPSLAPPVSNASEWAAPDPAVIGAILSAATPLLVQYWPQILKVLTAVAPIVKPDLTKSWWRDVFKKEK